MSFIHLVTHIGFFGISYSIFKSKYNQSPPNFFIYIYSRYMTFLPLLLLQFCFNFSKLSVRLCIYFYVRPSFLIFLYVCLIVNLSVFFPDFFVCYSICLFFSLSYLSMTLLLDSLFLLFS